MRQPLTIAAVGQMFGHRLPEPGRRGRCPLRKHKRTDPTFRVWIAGSGDPLWKCWSCDPPDNAGDAVSLYALLAGIDRLSAWKKLADDGFQVPGVKDDPSVPGARPRPPPPRMPLPDKKPPIPMRGTRMGRAAAEPPLEFHEDEWRPLLSRDTGLLAAFANKRGLPVHLFKSYGVVETQRGDVGFLYVDPLTRRPCRMKVKRLAVGEHAQAPYFIVPRDKRLDGEEGGAGRTALNPLYLAHRLQPRGLGYVEPCVIVEGEIDALSLVWREIPNVVSLPDGAESAKSVSLEPLHRRFTVWLIATDADAPGEASYRVLRDRAAACGVDTARVYWKKLRTTEDGSEGELVAYKDANDALVHGGFVHEDFARCLDVAMEQRFTFSVRWRT